MCSSKQLLSGNGNTKSLVLYIALIMHAMLFNCILQGFHLDVRWQYRCYKNETLNCYRDSFSSGLVSRLW